MLQRGTTDDEYDFRRNSLMRISTICKAGSLSFFSSYMQSYLSINTLTTHQPHHNQRDSKAQTVNQMQLSRAQWKGQIQRITATFWFFVYTDESDHLPRFHETVHSLAGQRSHLRFPILSRKNISQTYTRDLPRLLMNCYGLASDVCRLQTISSSFDH